MKIQQDPDWHAIADELATAIRSADIPTLVNALHTYDEANGNEWSRRVKARKGFYNYGDTEVHPPIE